MATIAPEQQEEKTVQSQYDHGVINVVKHMWFYVGFSLLITIPGLVIMVMSMMSYPTHSPLRLGIDFTGGTLLQYGFTKALTQDDIPTMREAIEKTGVHGVVIQLQQAEKGLKGETNNATTEQIKTDTPEAPKAPLAQAKGEPSITDLFKDAQAELPKTKVQELKSIISLRTPDLTSEQTIGLQKALKDTYGDFALLQKNRVGPTLAKELFIKAGIGLLVAYLVIVVYLAIRFQLDYALMAIVALVHDTIFMLGAFSILGWFFGIEVDSLFVTSILTVIGFSVHDTIVVYDRIRENARVLYTKKLPFGAIVNISVNQTLARSINTSLTALLTLVALYLFGGESTRTFVLAMILGIAVGTYSSIFVASSLLAWWRSRSTAKTKTA